MIYWCIQINKSKSWDWSNMYLHWETKRLFTFPLWKLKQALMCRLRQLTEELNQNSCCSVNTVDTPPGTRSKYTGVSCPSSPNMAFCKWSGLQVWELLTRRNKICVSPHLLHINTYMVRACPHIYPYLPPNSSHTHSCPSHVVPWPDWQHDAACAALTSDGQTKTYQSWKTLFVARILGAGLTFCPQTITGSPTHLGVPPTGIGGRLHPTPNAPLTTWSSIKQSQPVSQQPETQQMHCAEANITKSAFENVPSHINTHIFTSKYKHPHPPHTHTSTGELAGEWK